MKTALKPMCAVVAGLMSIAALPAFAGDDASGEVLAFDRSARLLVLTDKTVWQMPEGLAIPADLKSGDRVYIEFDTLEDDGITGIGTLTRTVVAPVASAKSGS